MSRRNDLLLFIGIPVMTIFLILITTGLMITVTNLGSKVDRIISKVESFSIDLSGLDLGSITNRIPFNRVEELIKFIDDNELLNKTNLLVDNMNKYYSECDCK